MLETCLRWLARTIDANPRRIAIACLFVPALAPVVVTRIPVTTDILDVLPERTPAITAFTDFLRDFGVLGGLVIVLEIEEASPDSLIATVESLGEQLSASPFVASVDYNVLRSGSRFVGEHFPVYLDGRGISELAGRLSPEGIRSQIRRDKQALLSPLASPFEGDLIRRDPLNVREVVRESLIGRLPATGLDVSTGYYLDTAHRLAFLMVRPKGSSRDVSFVGGLQREVRRISAQAIGQAGNPQSIRVSLAGGYARAAEAVSVIWRDMLFSFASSFLLVFLILYFAFRPSVVVLGIFAATMFASLAWTLLLAYLLYGTLNIITSIVAAMLIGLFVDYMIQLYRRFEECYRLEGNRRQALEKTLTGTGKAVVSAALTSALSFFSVVVAPTSPPWFSLDTRCGCAGYSGPIEATPAERAPGPPGLGRGRLPDRRAAPKSKFLSPSPKFLSPTQRYGGGAMRSMLILVVLALNFSLAAAQVPFRQGVTITPPQPMAAIEFVQESGVERWEVKLNRGGSIENAYLRISGPSCTHMDEIYRGMITPLYEDMTFKTKSGKTCTVQAIER